MKRSTSYVAALGGLAAILLLATAEQSQAQFGLRIGGGGGRGHGGGVSVNIGQPGYYGGGHYGGGYYGGGYYGNGFYHNGFYNNGLYYGSAPYYSNYSSYPYGYGYENYPIQSYSNIQSYQVMPPYSNALGSNVSLYPPASGTLIGTTDDPNSAMIEVTVPANAELWFDGVKTSQTGSTRYFVTPPLTAGKTYTYEIRMSTPSRTDAAADTRQVQVQAGKRSTVNFMEPVGASQ